MLLKKWGDGIGNRINGPKSFKVDDLFCRIDDSERESSAVRGSSSGLCVNCEGYFMP
jgi:hypothetical protein